MPQPHPRFSRNALALWVAFVLLLAVGGGVAWLLAQHSSRSPLRILLVTPAPGPDAGGLDAAEARAIGALIEDLLEHRASYAVTIVTSLPQERDIFRSQGQTLVLQIEPRRQGSDLALPYRFTWGRKLAGGDPAWAIRDAGAQLPLQAIETFLRSLPRAVPVSTDALIPKSPEVFWDVIRAGAWRLQNQHKAEALALAEKATRQEPSCASAWVLLGNIQYRRMLDNPSTFRKEQADTDANLQRGLELAPGHPRGTFLASLLKVDNGNQGEALDLLLRARRRQPHNPMLLTGIAYAARTAGLLPLARQAMELRDHIAFSELQPQAVDITYLYTGELARFEASLQEQPGHLRSTTGVLPFYRGYLALVRGDRALAHTEFRKLSSLANAYPNLLRLSRIFDLILDGKKDEAWKSLREYDQERIGMREPDGEFTIRLAEAYALLGDRASAMDMAGRAFARGFGCTDWYERSPMLESLRDLPKWKALMQHILERQKLMEARFPVGLLENV